MFAGFHSARPGHAPLSRQRVDSHLYGVAVLTQILVPPTGGEEGVLRAAKLMAAALVDGDIAEWISGDVPAPSKRHMGLRERFREYEDELLAKAYIVPPELDARDRRVLKLADAAEGGLDCIAERMLGNQNIGERAFYAVWSYLHDEQQICEHPEWQEVGEVPLERYIRDKWQQANGGSW